MSYTSSDLQLDSQSIAGKKKWVYASLDATTAISVSSYVTDAYSKGLAAGDEISVYNSSTPKLTNFMAVTVRTSSSADLSPGVITSS